MGVVEIKPPPIPPVAPQYCGAGRGRTPSPKGGTTNFDETRSTAGQGQAL